MTTDTMHGFAREDLEAIADGLDGYERTVNVGNVAGTGDHLLESTTAAAARFIRAALADRAERAAPTDVELLHFAGGHEDPASAPAASWQFDNDELVALLRNTLERFGAGRTNPIPGAEGSGNG